MVIILVLYLIFFFVHLISFFFCYSYFSSVLLTIQTTARLNNEETDKDSPEQGYVWGRLDRRRDAPTAFRPFEEIRGIAIRKVILTFPRRLLFLHLILSHYKGCCRKWLPLGSSYCNRTGVYVWPR
jgi:hypothetical protein